MPTPALRSRKFLALALALALLTLTGVSAQLPDGLLPPKPPAKPDILPDLPAAPLPGGPIGALPPTEGPSPFQVPGGLSSFPDAKMGSVLPALPTLPAIPAQPAAPQPPIRYVNKPNVEFDFEVTKHGKAGVKSVSLWMRPVATATTPLPSGVEWKEVNQVNAEGDTATKLKCEIPTDGTYGVRLQLTGQNGRKSVELKADTAPEMVIVRDTVPPVVKDVALDPPAAGQKQAVIKWAATDANLGEKCVTLEYEQKAGAWLKLAEGVLNSGSYSWLLDDKLPVSTRVRVTVTDLAGNSTSATSAAPTNLDPVVPEGRLIGVRAVDPPPKPPQSLPLPSGAGLPPLPPPPPGAISPAK